MSDFRLMFPLYSMVHSFAVNLSFSLIISTVLLHKALNVDIYFYIIFILICTFSDHFEPVVACLKLCKKYLTHFSFQKLIFCPSLVFSSRTPLRPMVTHLNLPSFFWTVVMYLMSYVLYFILWGDEGVPRYYFCIYPFVLFVLSMSLCFIFRAPNVSTLLVFIIFIPCT